MLRIVVVLMILLDSVDRHRAVFAKAAFAGRILQPAAAGVHSPAKAHRVGLGAELSGNQRLRKSSGKLLQLRWLPVSDAAGEQNADQQNADQQSAFDAESSIPMTKRV